MSANNKPTSKITRRALIAAIPAASAAPLAVAVVPHPDAKLLAFCEKWWKLRGTYKNVGSRYDAGEISAHEADRLSFHILNECDAVADQIATTTAQTSKGILAQLEWLYEDYFADYDSVPASALAQIRAALTDAKNVLESTA